MNNYSWLPFVLFFEFKFFSIVSLTESTYSNSNLMWNMLEAQFCLNFYLSKLDQNDLPIIMYHIYNRRYLTKKLYHNVFKRFLKQFYFLPFYPSLRNTNLKIVLFNAKTINHWVQFKSSSQADILNFKLYSYCYLCFFAMNLSKMSKSVGF